jgi:hypothetical protein
LRKGSPKRPPPNKVAKSEYHAIFDKNNQIIESKEVFMRIIAPIVALALLLGFAPCMAYQSLQEVFDQATGQGEYDKYIELNPYMEYLGDLGIPTGYNVCIMGNGARIFSRNAYMVHVTVSAARLDIQNCVFIGGGGAVYLALGAAGTIKNNTIIGCSSAGIRTYTIGEDNEVYIYDNIITDCYDGVFCNEDEHPDYLGYNTVYNVGRYRYAEICPG